MKMSIKSLISLTTVNIQKAIRAMFDFNKGTIEAEITKSKTETELTTIQGDKDKEEAKE